MNKLEKSNDASLCSAELQIYTTMVYAQQSPRAPLPIQHITNDHLPNFYKYGGGVGKGDHILSVARTFEVLLYFWIKNNLGQKHYVPQVRQDRASNS